MFLLSFVIIFIASVVIPAIDMANNSAEEISRIGNAKISAQKIANEIDAISIAPSNAKSTIKVFVEEKSSVACNFTDPLNKKIDFSAEMIVSQYNPDATACSGTPLVCTGETMLSAPQTVAIACDFDSGSQVINGKQFKDVVIEKGSSGAVSVKYG
ncbi:MAG: hypothetical protein PHD95_01330 [Candidatus ainarchaeum sp.]|nr:hypothetical protein [Candidatus ainarchaeum sp.]